MKQIKLAQYKGFLNTPPLWKGQQFGLTQFEFLTTGVSIKDLESIPTNIRLGHQMEVVFLELLKQDDNYKVLLYNTPVKRGKQSIGEIDFIVEEGASKKQIHIELTYKFYLIDTNISEPIHQLIGPNRGDMFFTKMEKIKHRQNALLHTSEGIQTLNEYHINHQQIEHQTCYKAQLFTPYGIPKVHIRPLNSDCIIGYWLPFQEFRKAPFTQWKYYMPHKKEWVLTPHLSVKWESHFETLLNVNLRMIKENSPMLWLQKSDGVLEKLFVVWW